MSEQSLKNKVALVTGSSQGIGAAIALALGAQGASVVVNYPFDADKDRADGVVADVIANGGQAAAAKADVTRMDQLTALFDIAQDQFGGLDIVVSNAGGFANIKPFVETTEADYDQTVGLNAKANFFAMQLAAKRVRDGGRIIVLSSSTPSLPYPGCAVYAGSKAACQTYAKVLSKEIGARGVTVNAVSPGPTETEGMRNTTPLEAKQRAIAITPLGRLGQPEDVADVVCFLATENARWITGQNVPACGGYF